jgi:serine/threonine protein kinase
MGAERHDTLPGWGPARAGQLPVAGVPQADAERLARRGYRLLDRLGAGGMGEVWRARHVGLDRLVAIKRMRGNHPESSDRLVREARALARIRHPSIVQVFDVLVDDDAAPYLVMELLQGSDLARVIADGRGLPETRAVHLMLGVLSGLDATHRHGIVHGDVKPDNILLSADDTGVERAVLLDFGLAHTVDPDRGTTSSLAGTPDFMSPEQVVGEGIGPASDQWSACVTLYSLVTGRPPFARASLPALFDAIRGAPLSYPRDAGMDPRLFAILARGTRKDPAERYADLAELYRALDTWLRSRTSKPQPRS